MAIEPAHRSEYTGSGVLDRIQSNVRDLIAYVRGLSWLKQRSYVALSPDTATSSSTYTKLVDVDIATVLRTSSLLIVATAAGSKSSGAGVVSFQLLVDNVVVKGSYANVANNAAFPIAFMVRTPVSQGRHTVTLQWKTSAGVVSVNAASVVTEHAAIWVQEDA